MAHIIVDENACKGCMLCTTACPKKLISMSEQLNAKGFKPASLGSNASQCTGCGLCRTLCPDLCITVEK